MLLGDNTDSNSQAYRDASPATYVSPKSAPALLLHGQHDKIAPNSESVRFDALLRAVGVASAAVIMEGAGHGDFGSNPGPVVGKLLSFIKGTPDFQGD